MNIRGSANMLLGIHVGLKHNTDVVIGSNIAVQDRNRVSSNMKSGSKRILFTSPSGASQIMTR